MSNLITRPKNNGIELHKFRNGSTSILKYHSNFDIVINSNKIEVYRVQEGIEATAKIVAGYIIQANLLLSKSQRMPANQIVPVCKHLLDGIAWNLNFEEISNIIMSGINGQYGKIYQLDMPTIGGWIKTYQENERELIFADKEYYREQKRGRELDSMGENHAKLFKSVLGKGGNINKRIKESAKRFKAYDSKIKKLQNYDGHTH